MDEMKAIVEEHYRLPDNLFEFQVRGRLSTAPEWFRVDGIRCFGRRWKPETKEANERAESDVAQEVQFDGHCFSLPFDLSEIVAMLWRERYDRGQTPGRFTTDAIRAAYYFFRPLLPVAARKYAQRRALHGWEQRSFPAWPVDQTADQLIELPLKAALSSGKVDSIPFIWFWPAGKRGCVVMTHDVETRQGLEDCPALMDIDSSYEIRSSFQLIPGGRYHVTQTQIDNLRDRGFEVNVHDWNHDGKLFGNRSLFLERAAKINACAAEWEAKGFRAGALYRNPEWLKELHVAYDMSSPNVAHLDPQRGGCCTLFPWFAGEVLEIPLTMTQDYSLFHILGDYSLTLWKRQLELIVAAHGMASIIVHPDYIRDVRARRVYHELLAYLRTLRHQHDLWMALPGTVNDWWRQRRQMQLVRVGQRWEIVGNGSELASIAYARLKDGKLVYTVEAPGKIPAAAEMQPRFTVMDQAS